MGFKEAFKELGMDYTWLTKTVFSAISTGAIALFSSFVIDGGAINWELAVTIGFVSGALRLFTSLQKKVDGENGVTNAVSKKSSKNKRVKKRTRLANALDYCIL